MRPELHVTSRARRFGGFGPRRGTTPRCTGSHRKNLVLWKGQYGLVANPLYWSVALVLLGEAAVFHFGGRLRIRDRVFRGGELDVLGLRGSQNSGGHSRGVTKSIAADCAARMPRLRNKIVGRARAPLSMVVTP